MAKGKTAAAGAAVTEVAAEATGGVWEGSRKIEGEGATAETTAVVDLEADAHAPAEAEAAVPPVTDAAATAPDEGMAAAMDRLAAIDAELVEIGDPLAVVRKLTAEWIALREELEKFTAVMVKKIGAAREAQLKAENAAQWTLERKRVLEIERAKLTV